MSIYEEQKLLSVPAKIIELPSGTGGASTSEAINYAYRSNVDSTVWAILGIKEITDPKNPPPKTVFGTNFPKPPRATKRYDTGQIRSSFIDVSQIKIAKAAGWTIQRSGGIPRAIKLSSNTSSRVVTCYVEILGIKRAWNMKDTQYAKISGDLAGLGIKEAALTDIDELVWGCEFPMPPKARKVNVNSTSGSVDTYTTFYDPIKTLPAGWMHVQNGVLDLSYLA